jgi:hypothetical protein
VNLIIRLKYHSLTENGGNFMKKSTKKRGKSLVLTIGFMSVVWIFQTTIAQQIGVIGPQQIRWMRVGSLHCWFSNAGSEIEYGRRGRSGFLIPDQKDGLNWPAQYPNQEHRAAKSIKIGTTNFFDPDTNITYSYKVVSCGTRQANLFDEMMPYEFKMIGRFDHPIVTVNGILATDNALNDSVDYIDPDLMCDRLIVSKLHTSIGVSFTRKIMAFTNQYHDNYFIYDYVFKNTGIIDLEGTELEPIPTLTDVVFHFQYRYAFADEAVSGGWAPPGVNWGRNTVNDVVGENNLLDGSEFRALLSWYGPHSQNGPWEEDVGAPWHTNGTIMAGTQYAGVVTIHADLSAGNIDDDPFQPATTQFLGSDNSAQFVDQYDSTLMSENYEFMSAGHPEQSHAEQVGTGFANNWGDDPGGYAQGQGFGPYTLAPGDSIHIVLAEAISGLSRQKNQEVVQNWFNENAPYTLPDGSTTSDRNEYKNAWVWSGKDSLFQTFHRAINNYNSDFTIPQPPPPPDEFMIISGEDRIFLIWSESAESWPNFDGYQIYRAVGRADTSYEMIFSCNRENNVHMFVDTTALSGYDYYYYIITKDDGSTNDIGPGIPLVSGKFYTMTSIPANFGSPPSTPNSVEKDNRLNMSFRLDQNYPNPFNPSTMIRFVLPKSSNITLKVYDLLGREIETIFSGFCSAGENKFTWHPKNLANGVYIYRLQAGDFLETKKMILLK